MKEFKGGIIMGILNEDKLNKKDIDKILSLENNITPVSYTHLICINVASISVLEKLFLPLKIELYKSYLDCLSKYLLASSINF